jgi:fibronectin-binding autotransporter adhesin
MSDLVQVVVASQTRSLTRSCWRIAFLAGGCLAVTLSAGRVMAGTNGVWTRTTQNGLWSTIGNWSGNTIADGQDGLADFSTLDLTLDEAVHLNTTRTIGNLKFGDTVPGNNWILDNQGVPGNVLTLSVSSGTPTITVNNDQATISGVLAGTQGFADAGSGTLVLTGANTYTGATTINSGSTLSAVWTAGGPFGVFASGNSIVNNGTLILTRNSNDSAFFGVITGSGTTTVSGDGGYLNLGNGGDGIARLSSQSDLMLNIGLNLFKNAQTIGALNGNGTITSNTGGASGNVTLTLGNNNHSGTFGGVINNAGSESIAVVKAGSGTQVLSGANTYAGGTTISGGVLQLGDGATLNGSVVGNITDNATLTFANPNPQTYSGVIAGSGNLTKIGAGTLTLSGASTYAGNTAVDGGTLLLSSPGNMTQGTDLSVGDSGVSGQSGTFSLNGSALFRELGAGTVTIGAESGSTGTLNIGTTASGATLTTGSGGMTINTTGNVNIGSGSVVKGTLNANGNVTINGGTLSVVNTSAFNLATGATLTLQNGGTFTYADFNSLTHYVTPANTIFNVTGQNSTLLFTNATSRPIIADGAQLNVLSGGTATFASGLNVGIIAGGSATLSVDGSGSSVSAAILDCGPGGTVAVTNGGSLSLGIDGLILDGGAVTINGGNFFDGLDIVFHSGTINFIAGSFSIQEDLEVGASGLLATEATGSGVISLNTTLAPNRQLTTSGTTTIDAGQTLTLAGGSLSTGALVINGTLAFNSGTLAITGGGLTIGAGGLLGSSLSLTSGQILNVTNTTTVNSGSTFNVNGGSFLGGTLTNNGRTILDTGTLSLSGPLANDAGGYFFVSQNQIATVNGASTNAGEILLGGADATLNGAGTLTNTGLIHGDGHIGMAVTNAAAGELRAESGKRMKFTGAVSANAGRIDLLGGIAEFSNPLTNGATGQIIGSGTLIVGSTGLTNNGQILLSGGPTNFFGDVNNNTGNPSKGINVTGNSNVTFWDDVTNTGVSQFKVTSGSSATFFGSYGGTGTSGGGDLHFEGDLTPGFSPASVTLDNHVVLGPQAVTKIELGGTAPGSQFDQLHITRALELDGTLQVTLINGFGPTAGQSFDILDWGSLIGTFAAIQLPALAAGESWDSSQLYATGVLSVVGAGLPGDYNHNGIVDAADYVAWRNGLGTTYTQADYDVWRAHFGQTAGSGAGATANAAVPEPVTLVLLAFAAAGCCLRRGRIA